MDYLTVPEAQARSGLRLVLTAGVPGPWGESAKAMMAYKGLEYQPVQQLGGGENPELLDWTGQTSAPVLVTDDRPPLSHWLDLLMALEALQPEPALLPASAAGRAQVIGLSALIAGVDGFGWNRRLQMLAPMMSLDSPPDAIARMGRKYGWSEAATAAAEERIRDICAHLEQQLLDQAEAGNEYLAGAVPTAADFYWANFAGMIRPLPPADNPMPESMRAVYEAAEPGTAACLTPRLLAHRAMMYQRHIRLPLDF